MHYDTFPYLGAFLAILPTLKGPRAISQYLKKSLKGDDSNKGSCASDLFNSVNVSIDIIQPSTFLFLAICTDCHKKLSETPPERVISCSMNEKVWF